MSDSLVVGLLGYDFIASSIVGLDFKNQTVTLYPRAAFSPQSLGVRPLHVMLDDGVPRVPVTIENVPGWFLLDTGAFGVLIYRHYLSKLPDVQASDSPINEISAVGGNVGARAYALKSFAFGPVMFATAQVFVPEESTIDLSDYDGIIGRNALSVYRVWLDYATQTAYLQQNAR